MSHDHHGHHHDDAAGWRILVALGLNVGITVAQIVGGLLSGSLALLGDAAHNGSDAAALGIAYVAQRLSRRPADRHFTFGYERAKAVGALVNLTALYVIALYLGYEGVRRLFDPPEVEGLTVLIVGGIAFVEDLLSVLVLWKSAEGNVNVKAAAIHLIGDTLATVGVLVSGALILWQGITWVDPAVTLAIAAYIVVHATIEMRKVIRLLMERVPEGFDVEALAREAGAVEGVEGLLHVHVWALDEGRTALEARVAVRGGMSVAETEGVKDRLRALAHERHGVEHATFETVPAEAGGTDAAGDAGLIADE